MSRFTKSAAIADLQAMADSYQAKGGFDLGKGTSQLKPIGADERMRALIERSVLYGQMRALEAVVEAIAEGRLGVSVK